MSPVDWVRRHPRTALWIFAVLGVANLVLNIAETIGIFR